VVSTFDWQDSWSVAEHIALPQHHRASLRGTLVVALAVASVVAAAALIVEMRSSGNGTASSAKSNRTNSYVATPALLRATSQALGHQIYWAGPRAKATYELTVTRGGFVYVRYLTAGAKVGDPRPNFVTIGTYPKANAYSVLAAARTIKNARVESLGNGQLAVSYANRPGSVYVAHRGSNLMVEVFAPVARGAESIVRTGLIAPVR
jgi:hypothetical protein